VDIFGKGRIIQHGVYKVQARESDCWVLTSVK
jgi:hypothetical protein